MPSVEIAVMNYVATIRLNRPEALNSVDPEMRVELHRTWERVRTDPSIRVAILTGAGDRAFCTGSDLKKTMPAAESYAEQTFGPSAPSAFHAGLERCDKPLIAAVNGYAMGGGMELALACDIRVCSENAQFALSEVRIGSVPAAGGTQRLPRCIGRSDAMLLLLTGDRIDAPEALRIGLVSRVVPLSKLMDEAHGIARRIADNAPLSVSAIKRLVNQGMEMPLQAALEAERYAFGLLYNTEDRIEGRRAFAEKRKPVWRGR